MEFRKNSPLNSKRLARTMLLAFEQGVGSQPLMLDCYDNQIWRDKSVAITTRIDACNHYYLMQVYEIPN